MADVSRGMESMCFNNFWLKLSRFKPDPVMEWWKALFNNCFLGFLLVILSCQAFLVIVFIYLSFNSFGFQLCLEGTPLALWPTFGPSVEFWVWLPFHKAQVHVIISLSATCGISTKPPPTLINHEKWDLRGGQQSTKTNGINWKKKRKIYWQTTFIMLGTQPFFFSQILTWPVE